MPRPRPSDWKPAGIELYEMRAVFSLKDRLAFLEFVGAGSSTSYMKRTLRNRIMNAAAHLNAALHYARAPTLASTKAGVSKLRDQLTEVSAVLDGLDYSGRKALSNAADDDSLGGRLAMSDGPRFEFTDIINGKPQDFRQHLGDERIATVSNGLKDMIAWADSVLQMDDAEEIKERAQKAEAIRICLRCLVDVWKDGWGRRPQSNATHANFTPFARAVLNPIMARHGRVDDLTRAISDVLYK
ncbi:hypothetical protein [Aureimonas psammosilenae]|uniref:hypothetical protein n=1 Tax=Aureimonas psammosilenae TaxID=2495496 RepID=UPI00126085AD|nr:hypothetical protein [Aureimonas psammosilenae]